MYVDRRLPKEVRENEVLFGEGLGGASYVQGMTCIFIMCSRKQFMKRAGTKRQIGQRQFYKICVDDM